MYFLLINRFLVGTYATWQVQALACGALPALSFCLMLLVPESSRFLVKRGKLEEARKALSWFRDLPPSCQQVGIELLKVSEIVFQIFFRHHIYSSVFKGKHVTHTGNEIQRKIVYTWYLPTFFLPFTLYY